MQSAATTPAEYIKEIPIERREAIIRLRKEINSNIPEGFREVMSYGMLGWVVPHSVYPGGYHCDPKVPLPFMSIASQKNFIALYHMGIYAQKELLDWFVKAYGTATTARLDMGKSCIRFKNPEKIPFQLVGELAGKLTAEEWIRIYESNLKR